MNDAILALVPTYGLWLLLGVGVLAAIGLPLPSTLTNLAFGAFIASGDVSLWAAFGVAFLAAVLGDQIGYHIGLFAGNTAEEMLAHKPSRAAKITRSKALIRRWGGLSVFLSRWLVSPVGPTINILTGASDMHWLRFSLWDLAGELVWVTLYLGLGYLFGGNIEALAALLGNASWTILAAVAAGILGYRLLKALRKIRAEGAV